MVANNWEKHTDNRQGVKRFDLIGPSFKNAFNQLDS